MYVRDKKSYSQWFSCPHILNSQMHPKVPSLFSRNMASGKPGWHFNAAKGVWQQQDQLLCQAYLTSPTWFPSSKVTCPGDNWGCRTHLCVPAIIPLQNQFYQIFLGCSKALSLRKLWLHFSNVEAQHAQGIGISASWAHLQMGTQGSEVDRCLCRRAWCMLCTTQSQGTKIQVPRWILETLVWEMDLWPHCLDNVISASVYIVLPWRSWSQLEPSATLGSAELQPSHGNLTWPSLKLVMPSWRWLSHSWGSHSLVCGVRGTGLSLNRMILMPYFP